MAKAHRRESLTPAEREIVIPTLGREVFASCVESLRAERAVEVAAA
jgi:hypothetical protein